MPARIVRQLSAWALAVLLMASLGCGSTEPSGEGHADFTLTMGLTKQLDSPFPGVPTGSVVWLVPGGLAGSVDSTGLFTAGTTAGTWMIVALWIGPLEQVDTMWVQVKPLASTTPLGLPAYGIAVNGANLIAAPDNGATLRFRTNSGTVSAMTVAAIHAAFAPGSLSTLYATSYGGWLYRIDASTKTVVDSVGFGAAAYNLAVRPNGSMIAVTTEYARLFKVDPATFQVQDSVVLASASNGLAFSPDGSALWVTTIEAGRLYRIDPGTFNVVDSFDLGGGLQRVVVSPGGDSVYAAAQDAGRLYLIRASDRMVTFRQLVGSPHGVGISDDGTRLYVAHHTPAIVSVFDRATLTPLGIVPLVGTPRNVAALHGGSSMLVTTESNTFLIH